LLAYRLSQERDHAVPRVALHGRILSRNGDAMGDSLLFEIQTPRGFAILFSRTYWTLTVSKEHPVLAGCGDAVGLR
jgi:hypothetical protein